MTQANINENWTIGDFLGLDNDGDGDYDTADQDCVVNQPPTADPNGPYNGTVGEQVAFDGSGSNDPDGTIDAYAWDFGDGNTGTGVSPAHTYGTAGTYTVALTVTDNDGGNDTATTTATISDVPQLAPVADPNGPYTGAVGAPVQFDGSGSNDPDGTIVAYDWDFGDGNTGAGVNPAHNYAAAGTYTVALTVTDNDGLTDTATTTATIADVPPQPPVADPNGPYSGTVGDPVQFDGSGSFDPDGTIVSYLWDFSDGSTGAGQNPIHIYSTAGTYTVALTVTDNDGLTNTATTTATIHNQIEGDVSLEKLQAPKNLKIGKRAVSKKNTAIGEADTKAQDATVTLSWEMVPMGLVNIIVFPDPPRITQAVTPDKGSDRFKFNTDITCNQSATQGTITWTAQIDAPENRDPSNDVVTATSNVTCR
jgi:PKD repeat protein